MQNYLRNQGCTTNYDIVQKLIDLLRAYLNDSFQFQKCTQPVFDQITLGYDTHMKIQGCIDTLQDLVSACLENQKLMCQPNFLELVSKVLGVDDSHEVFRNVYSDLILEYFSKKKSYDPISVLNTLGKLLISSSQNNNKQEATFSQAQIFKKTWS